MAGEQVRALLDHIWATLEPLEFPCALMGGAALAVWQHPRATRDIDLLIGIDSHDFGAVVSQLAAAGCRAKKHPPLTTLGSLRFAQFLYTPPEEFYDAQFDLWLADTELQKSAISRRIRCEIPGVNRPIDVLNCDDLVLFKLLGGRIIDRADAAVLLRENREQIDFTYLRHWIERLDLERELTDIWRESFPGQELPR